jgi:glycosyltransferase involved in cell wall biosynthesis
MPTTTCDLAQIVTFLTVFILFFSDICWRGLHQRPHHIARALARYHPVLWIEPTTLLEQWHWKPIRVEPNIFVMSVPTIPFNARHAFIRLIARFVGRLDTIRKLMKSLQTALVRKAIRILGGEGEIRFIAHNFDILHFIDTFKPVRVLYDYIDNIFGFGSLPSYLRPIWEETVRRADVVTVTSHVLERQIRMYRNDNIHYVGNGVEFEVFSKIKAEYSQPLDLPIGKPIVGYIGAIYPWLDYDLIEYVSKKKTDVNVVLIGRVHPDVQQRVEHMKRLPNVHVLGFKPYREVPSYLAQFDVGIIPFQKNELTTAVNPVKLYEYSAAGVPTVATEFSEVVLRSRDIILIARTPEEFVSSIERGIQKRRDRTFTRSLQAFARQHDWSTKTSRIIELLQHTTKPVHNHTEHP